MLLHDLLQDLQHINHPLDQVFYVWQIHYQISILLNLKLSLCLQLSHLIEIHPLERPQARNEATSSNLGKGASRSKAVVESFQIRGNLKILDTNSLFIIIYGYIKFHLIRRFNFSVSIIYRNSQQALKLLHSASVMIVVLF